jgi:hypothetical protein
MDSELAQLQRQVRTLQGENAILSQNLDEAYTAAESSPAAPVKAPAPEWWKAELAAAQEQHTLDRQALRTAQRTITQLQKQLKG